MDEQELKARYEALAQEHRDLDAAIEALSLTSGHDQIQLARLKKRKLKLKDELTALSDMILPDIIA